MEVVVGIVRTEENKRNMEVGNNEHRATERTEFLMFTSNDYIIDVLFVLSLNFLCALSVSVFKKTP